LNQRTSNRRLVTIMVAVVVVMFGFGYALVPIYNVFCKVVGLNGKTGGPVNYYKSTYIDKSRSITVEFMSVNNNYLPWDFRPMQKKIHINPGAITRVSYYARNNTDHPMTIQAIPSVTPGYAAKYLKKTECFCFTRTTLKAHEVVKLPILFHLDTHLPKKVKQISLGYTLFDVSKLGGKVFKNEGHIS